MPQAPDALDPPLPYRTQRVRDMRAEGRTYREIAGTFNVSVERVRQLERQADHSPAIKHWGLDLPVAVYNTLRRGGLETREAVASASEADLRAIPNLGAKGIATIDRALATAGLPPRPELDGMALERALDLRLANVERLLREATTALATIQRDLAKLTGRR